MELWQNVKNKLDKLNDKDRNSRLKLKIHKMIQIRKN